MLPQPEYVICSCTETITRCTSTPCDGSMTKTKVYTVEIDCTYGDECSSRIYDCGCYY